MDRTKLVTKLNELIGASQKILNSPQAIEKGERKALSNRVMELLKNANQMQEEEYIEKINVGVSIFNEEYENALIKARNMKNLLVSLKDKIELEDEIDNIQFHAKKLRYNELIKEVKSNEVNWDSIHKDIISVSKSKFEAGYTADAVESAFKAINSRVKDIYKKRRGQELDGADLMRKAFSLTDPIIILEDISTVSGKNVQSGYMEIFAGAMIGIRNPFAHENLKMNLKLGIHCLYLASHLMYKLDGEMTT